MDYKGNEPVKKQLNDFAHYFVSKNPWEIDFADADNGDYFLYLIERKWQKEHGDTFAKTFPYIDKLWNILSEWKVEETRTIAEREKIIDLAKCHLEQEHS